MPRLFTLMEFRRFWFMLFLSTVIASEATQSQIFWDCFVVPPRNDGTDFA
ncbi:hypothetical protein [Calothrix sp. NIES-2098]